MAVRSARSLLLLLAAGTLTLSACQQQKSIAEGTSEQVAVDIGELATQFTLEYSNIDQGQARLLIRASSPNNRPSNDQLESVLRWCQIIVDRDPLVPPQGLPRFDVGPSAQEVAGDPNSEAAQKRQRRQTTHNPFQAGSQGNNRTFTDRPTVAVQSVDKWDAYVILFRIRTDATHWDAEILRVWRWTYDKNRRQKATLVSVKKDDAEFVQALNKAIDEFGKDANGNERFKPGVRYPLPVPSPYQ